MKCLRPYGRLGSSWTDWLVGTLSDSSDSLFDSWSSCLVGRLVDSGARQGLAMGSLVQKSSLDTEQRLLLRGAVVSGVARGWLAADAASAISVYETVVVGGAAVWAGHRWRWWNQKLGSLDGGRRARR